MNLNDFDRELTLDEGGKINLPIGQVKEVRRLVLLALKKLTLEEVASLLKRMK